MADRTGIEWTDATWNPITGCNEVSPGCDHCYAKTFAERWRGTPGHYFERGFDVQLRPDKLLQPARWKRPRRIFVNSMSDLFHDQVPDEYIARVWGVMAWSPRHTYQILTKRHGRMRSLLNSRAFKSLVDDAWYEFGPRVDHHPGAILHPYDRWPLPNVWLGVSTENQQWADIRIPALLDTPAAVRFISAEPLLGPISIFANSKIDRDPGLDWVIAGGESGRGARPMHPGWVRSLRDECVRNGVPFLFKQQGEYQWLPMPDDDGADLYVERETGRTATDDTFWHVQSGHWWGVRRVGKHRAGRELDGRTWDQYPDRTQEVPA